MLLTRATIWLVLVTNAFAQLSQNVKENGAVDSSYELWNQINNKTYLEELQKKLMMPNMDTSALYQGYFTGKSTDEQIEFSFNPLRVNEILECPEDIAKEKVILDQAQLADALLQTYIQQKSDANSTSEYNEFFFGIGNDVAALIVADDLDNEDIDFVSMLMTLGFMEGDDFEGDPDDEVVIEFILASPNQDARHPFIGVRQQVLHDGMSDNANMISKIDRTPIDPDWPLCCDLPTFVTHMHVENSESAVVMVGTSKLDCEPWFPKLPPYYQMLLSNLHDRDSVVVQMHEYTRVSYLLPYCEYSGKWYKFGQRIPVYTLCRVCMCGPEFQGHGIDSCYREDCSWDRFVASYAAEGCHPEYVHGECCPNIVCPDGSIIEDAIRKNQEKRFLFDGTFSEKKRMEYNMKKEYDFKNLMFPHRY